MKFYTFEGYPYLDENGQNPHVPLDTTHNERHWPGDIDKFRVDGRMTIVDQRHENHPNPKAGRGWACATLCDLSVYPGFVEVDADGPDGAIIHKLYGEHHCPVHADGERAAVHDCARTAAHLSKCEKDIESSEKVCDECSDELAVLNDEKLADLLPRTVKLLEKEKIDHEKHIERLDDLKSRIIPEKTKADEKFAALKAELESKRGGS